MKLQITGLAAVLSLLPLVQPLVIGTGAIFFTFELIFFSQQGNAVPNTPVCEKDYFKKNPERYYKCYGNLKKEQRDFIAAISFYEKAIMYNPGNEDRGYYLTEIGWIKRVLKDNVGACSAWITASLYLVDNRNYSQDEYDLNRWRLKNWC